MAENAWALESESWVQIFTAYLQGNLIWMRILRLLGKE